MSLPMPGMTAVPPATINRNMSIITPALRLGGRVDAYQSGDVGVVGAQPQGQRPTHAQPDDDDLSRPLAEELVGRLGGTGPVGPAGRHHVVDDAAVTG